MALNYILLVALFPVILFHLHVTLLSLNLFQLVRNQLLDNRENWYAK